MTAARLIVALDGADADLLNAMINQGALGNLRALAERGATRLLAAPCGATDDALWASVHFAARLGDHGRYHYEIEAPTGQISMAYLRELDRSTVWARLGELGRRIAVVDVPKCPAPRPINGLHLADWLVHGRYFAEPVSFPEDLAAHLVRTFGAAPASRCGQGAASLDGDDVSQILAALKLSLSRKLSASLHLLRQEEWDDFVVCFKEVHCAGHAFWALSDPDHAAYDAERSARLGDPVRELLLLLDEAVGELVAASGEGAEVFVFSPNSMGPNATLDHFADQLMRRLNQHLFGRWQALAQRSADRLGLRGFRLPHVRLLPYSENCLALRIASHLGSGEPSRTRRRELGQRIGAIFLDIVDAASGRAIVAGVDYPSTLLSGERAHELPDVLVRLRPNAKPASIHSSVLGRFAAEPPKVRSGNHIAGGILIGSDQASVAAVRDVEDLGDWLYRTARAGA